jgi:hypothetical protein
METELFIIENLEIIFLSSKNSDKILNVANDVIYKYAKTQRENLSSLGYTKMTNVWICE